MAPGNLKAERKTRRQSLDEEKAQSEHAGSY
jgi:hypothetical protein